MSISVIESQSNSALKGCPPAEEIQAARDSLKAAVHDILQHVIPMCGHGLWHRVAFLNMSDPTQQCPSAWGVYSSNGTRTCARPTNNLCPGVAYSVNHQYSKVCGRIIGYQVGSPDVFVSSQGMTINQAYMAWMALVFETNGTPRIHIWSYAAGANEAGHCPGSTCPTNCYI